MTPLTWKQDDYIRAYVFAARALNSKKVPGTDLPYIVHVSLVSMEVQAVLSVESELNGNLALQCSLLHDVIEDGGITIDQLNAEFGSSVAQGVSALSKNPNLEKSLQMNDSLRRIKQQSPEIWIVKMADRITNLLPPPSDWTSINREAYKYEAREIYESLKSANKFIADRLLFKIEAYDKYIH
jgi:(p)ppGpp synthase/HD superfamily hydrolase